MMRADRMSGVGARTVSRESRRQAAGIKISVEPDFDFLSDEYHRLFARSSATAFQHPLWLSGLYRNLAPARGAEPLAVVGRDAQTGAADFVLPLIRRRKNGIVLIEATDLGVSDYSAPVATRDFAAPPALRTIVAEALPAHDLLRLRPVRAESVDAWQAFFDVTSVRLDFSAHAVALEPDYQGWRRRALSPGFAKGLDRKKARFARDAQGELRLLRDPSEIRDSIAAIQALRAGRFAGDQIQQDFVRDFYAGVATAGAADGFACTYVLLRDGEAIGHVFGLGHAGRFHYLMIGCDYERHGRHSPGLLLYDGIIQDWIAAGGTVFDFTIGDEAFKLDFGTTATPMFELSRAATLRGRLARAAFAAREALRRQHIASQAKPRPDADKGGTHAD